jgi:hypothetical protein
MVRVTVLYFIIQTGLVCWGFIDKQDWVFPLLAVVNLVAGPTALILFLVKRKAPS